MNSRKTVIHLMDRKVTVLPTASVETNAMARALHAKESDAKAAELLQTITPMDRLPMERYLAENPPDVATIAALAFVAISHKAKNSGVESRTNRWGPRDELKAWVITKYAERQGLPNYRSAAGAASELKIETIEKGRTLNFVMKESNAERTIAGWIRKENRTAQRLDVSV